MNSGAKEARGEARGQVSLAKSKNEANHAAWYSNPVLFVK